MRVLRRGPLGSSICQLWPGPLYHSGGILTVHISQRWRGPSGRSRRPLDQHAQWSSATSPFRINAWRQRELCFISRLINRTLRGRLSTVDHTVSLLFLLHCSASRSCLVHPHAVLNYAHQRELCFISRLVPRTPPEEGGCQLVHGFMYGAGCQSA